MSQETNHQLIALLAMEHTAVQQLDGYKAIPVGSNLSRAIYAHMIGALGDKTSAATIEGKIITTLRNSLEHPATFTPSSREAAYLTVAAAIFMTDPAGVIDAQQFNELRERLARPIGESLYVDGVTGIMNLDSRLKAAGVFTYNPDALSLYRSLNIYAQLEQHSSVGFLLMEQRRRIVTTATARIAGRLAA